MDLVPICRRRGIAWLTDKAGESIAIRTTCKTRSCAVCRHKVKAKFSMIVEYGCLTLDHLRFITLTLRAGEGLQKDARYVRRVWRKMLEYLRLRYPGHEWIKVVELTKQTQPHLHVVFANSRSYSEKAACHRKARYNDAWLDMKCECMEHELSRVWHRITGDSFVVDVQEVGSARKAASYLAKYLDKGISYCQELGRLGFYRTWSRSSGWPGEQLRLSRSRHREGGVTVESEWKRVDFTGPGQWAQEALTRAETSPLARRVGDNLSWLLQDRKDREVSLSKGREILKKYARYQSYDRDRGDGAGDRPGARVGTAA
jgi:hypothetical protein